MAILAKKTEMIPAYVVTGNETESVAKFPLN